ncbi:MAG: helix-turn-helix domain-containing protein, partial [Acidovorax sp.]
LVAREWPGNVRELKAVVESAGALLMPDQREVDAALLRLSSGDTEAFGASNGGAAQGQSAGGSAGSGPGIAADASAGPLDAALMEMELRMVRNTLAATGGNQSEAARRLGISRVGLVKKLSRLGLR